MEMTTPTTNQIAPTNPPASDQENWRIEACNWNKGIGTWKTLKAMKMKSTFWIQEIDDNGTRKLRLQYSQIVMLDFFPRRDGLPGLIRWPHVSINTLEKVEKP